mmetsp:Transcript_32315/g.108872  ORF Transcript_32315/g.108872 Transcript_32315/m.108872 type:complete len:207 (+) Transcript_32315:2033-2653(+)
MAHDLQRRLAEHVVLGIRQRLRRRDDDGVARVDAQRVKVLHVADSDAIVVAVAHHLVLHLLPPEHGLFHQQLRRHRQSLDRERTQLGLVVDDARPEAAQRKRGADHARVARDVARGRKGAGEVDDGDGDGRGLADLRHLVLKDLAVLRRDHRVDLRAQDADAVLGEDAALVQLDAAIQRRLAAHGDQNRIGLLALDHLLHEIGSHG